MRRALALAILPAAATLMLGTAMPASAAPAGAVVQGDDWSIYTHKKDRIFIHDKECDGEAAYAKWHFANVDNDGWKYVHDYNGCDKGGSRDDITRDFPRKANGVWLRTCESPGKCAGPKFFRK